MGRSKIKDFADRFWTRVDIRGVNECWEWRGARTYDGYGITSRDKKIKVSSRVAWELTHGEITNGMQVLHRCDNPPCCNPRHLFIGTQKENIADMYKKGRQHNKPLPPPERAPKPKRKTKLYGSLVHFAKLTDIQVIEIRSRYGLGESAPNLAREYHITRANVYLIVARKTWTHNVSKI